MNAADGEELRVDRAVHRASVVDAEGYKNSVRGVDIDAIRVGASDAPNHVVSVADDHLIITAGHIGFPISHTAHIADATTIVARIHSAPSGSRWAGVDLYPNQTLLYSPDVEHAGVDRPGTCFTFATTEIERVEQRAAQLRSSIHRLKPGSVRDVTAIADFSAVSSRLDPLEALRDGAFLPGNLLDDLLSSMAVALGRQELRQARPSARADGGRVILRCIEYASAVGRRPSVSELCLVAGVSTRTLRDVFISAFDMPPSVFFRRWALDLAHDRLASGEPIPGGVSDVALETASVISDDSLATTRRCSGSSRPTRIGATHRAGRPTLLPASAGALAGRPHAPTRFAPRLPPILASGPSWMHLCCRCRRGPIARTLASHADRVLGNARQDDRTASDLHGQRDAAQEDQSSGG